MVFSGRFIDCERGEITELGEVEASSIGDAIALMRQRCGAISGACALEVNPANRGEHFDMKRRQDYITERYNRLMYGKKGEGFT